MSRISDMKVIGASVKMQTLSLEEEIKLIEGLLFDIDIFQDFSLVTVDGICVEDIAISDVIMAIEEIEPVVINRFYDDFIMPSVLRYESRENNDSSVIRDVLAKDKKERKAEAKWDKKHPDWGSKECRKKAVKKFDKVLSKWGIRW